MLYCLPSYAYFRCCHHPVNLIQRSFSTSAILLESKKVLQHYSSCYSSEENQSLGLRDALELQGEQRKERRRAFLQWQAGQREKGAAHRLLRLARVVESNKRHHYHSQSGRLIGVYYATPQQKYDGREYLGRHFASTDLLMSPVHRIPKREK